MKWINRLLFLAFIMPANTGLYAQDEQQTEMKWRPVQVTFITPVGTNGLGSRDIGNDFSLNILFGMNGGLRGAEFSGLGGMLKGDMKGAQFAGLLNTAGGNVKGFQAAGLVNVAAGTLNGAQAAGLVNVSGKELKGFQAAGLVNVAADSSKGCQVAGLANVAVDGKVSQIAGLFNYTKRLNGVQIGLFNVADTVEHGVPIGLFSIVGRGGYHAFGISGNETFYGNASFMLGVKKFYNIFTTGIAFRDEKIIWGWGLGFGTQVRLGGRSDLSIEGLCYQVNVDEWFTHGPNLLGKLNLSFAWHLAPHLALTVTPSWNVTVSDMLDEYGEHQDNTFAPYSVYDYDFDNGMRLEMYPGLAIGIRI